MYFFKIKKQYERRENYLIITIFRCLTAIHIILILVLIWRSWLVRSAWGAGKWILGFTPLNKVVNKDRPGTFRRKRKELKTILKPSYKTYLLRHNLTFDRQCAKKNLIADSTCPLESIFCGFHLKNDTIHLGIWIVLALRFASMRLPSPSPNLFGPDLLHNWT